MTERIEEPMEANDASLVVSGAALFKKGMEHRPENVWGGVYALADGSVWRIRSDVLRQLPEGYSKWKGLS